MIVNLRLTLSRQRQVGCADRLFSTRRTGALHPAPRVELLEAVAKKVSDEAYFPVTHYTG